ncbi:MAG: repressor LexA [Anaerolineales bacterium]|nr:repressor LexA [Anaerolineales bacterium]
MIKISDKQERMLAFIEEFVGSNGYPPTYEEIRAGLNISTKSLVDYHLGVLESADFITRIPNTPRGLRLAAEPNGLAPVVKNGGEPKPVDSINLSEAEIVELTFDVVSTDSELYALKVDDPAIVGPFVGKGDIIILQRQKCVQNGEVIAARLAAQGQTALGRYYRENGHVRLEPVNTATQSMIVAPDALEIQGKVVAVIRQVDQTQPQTFDPKVI